MKQCTCYALRAVDCTCLPAKYEEIYEIYTTPDQEPVAYTTGHCKEKAKPRGCQLHNLHCGYPSCDRKAVTTPSQRTWVGLTPREIYNLWEDSGVPFVDWDSFASIAQAIQAKLKQKNGYAEEKNT